MTRYSAIVGLILCVWAIAPSRLGAQNPPSADSATLRGDVPQTRKRLSDIEQQILAGKLDGIIDTLLTLLQDGGDDLVSADGLHYLPGRHYVHRFIARLPEPLFKQYQDRVETPAAELLAQAETSSSPTALTELVRKYFCSRPAGIALERLGDWHYENAEFSAAEARYRQRLGDAPSTELNYPQPHPDRPRVEAKRLLSILQQRERKRFDSGLEEYAKAHPDAQGELGGRTGKYATLLWQFAEELKAPAPLPTQMWSTFAGSASRNSVVHGRLVVNSFPSRVIPIPTEPYLNRDLLPAAPPLIGAARHVAFHPAIDARGLYWVDAGRVLFAPWTDEPARVIFDFRLKMPGAIRAGDLALPIRFDADFAVTLAGDRLYARVGTVNIGQTEASRVGNRPQTEIIALRHPAERAEFLWRAAPPSPANSNSCWEGSPVISADRAIAAFTRTEAGRT
ncbi:MAG: hypothetical protein ACRCZF_14225, partial [Gemmataceae bacterium]